LASKEPVIGFGTNIATSENANPQKEVAQPRNNAPKSALRHPSHEHYQKLNLRPPERRHLHYSSQRNVSGVNRRWSANVNGAAEQQRTRSMRDISRSSAATGAKAALKRSSSGERFASEAARKRDADKRSSAKIGTTKYCTLALCLRFILPLM
jgi:hypothetical protein